MEMCIEEEKKTHSYYSSLVLGIGIIKKIESKQSLLGYIKTYFSDKYLHF